MSVEAAVAGPTVQDIETMIYGVLGAGIIFAITVGGLTTDGSFSLASGDVGEVVASKGTVLTWTLVRSGVKS